MGLRRRMDVVKENVIIRIAATAGRRRRNDKGRDVGITERLVIEDNSVQRTLQIEVDEVHVRCRRSARNGAQP